VIVLSKLVPLSRGVYMQTGPAASDMYTNLQRVRDYSF
jgi:hypothetical protein